MKTHIKVGIVIGAILLVILFRVISQTKTDSCTVALLHMNPEYQKKEENINKICTYALEAFENGANIVLTPEMATDDYFLSKEDVVSYAGIRDIESELSPISEIAKKYKGYICVGFPEIADDGSLYNSAVMFNKDGKIVLHERKRSIPGWNLKGNLEHTVYKTEYGKIGIIICADAYYPDDVSALKKLGADIILSPVTWYPSEYNGQIYDDSITSWISRAKENSLWYIACNRWGIETYNGEVQDMNMASSAVVSPDGEIICQYTANDNYQDKIVYCNINEK